MNDLSLFEAVEPYRADPPAKRTTRVREHEREITPRARRTDPQPSKDAAASLTVGRIEARITPVLERFGPQTADEIAARLPNEHSPSVKSGLARLHKAESIVDTGETRLSNRGRPSTVWRLA